MKYPSIVVYAWLLASVFLCAAPDGSLKSSKAQSEHAGGFLDTLEFLNGDVLHGRMVAVGPDFLTWQTSEKARAIEFRTAALADVVFAPRPLPLLPSTVPAGSVRVGLANSDEIPGAIVSLIADRLELQTSWAGKIAIPRKIVTFVAPARVSAAAVYEGPAGMQGWRHLGDKTWQFRNDALVAHGSGIIGRELEWPDLASVEFDLAWKGPLGFAIGLRLTSLNDSESDGYMLMLGDGSADLMRSRRGNTDQVGPAAEVPQLTQNDRAHVKIYINKKSKTLSLLLDGEHVHQWTDHGDLKLNGRILVLASQNDAPVKVSAIRVAAWNGRIEGAENETAAQGEDVMRLMNGDRVSGRLQSIQEGRVAFYTPNGALTVPLQNVDDVTIGTHPQPLMAKPGEVRAYLGATGRVTLALEKWDAKQAIVSIAGAGRATISTLAFKRIEFHAKPARDEDEYNGPFSVESAR